jgi:hypothetical protein
MQFSDEEIETVKFDFSKRFLNQWLVVEIPLSRESKGKFLTDMVDVSASIGSDGRIKRVASVGSRAQVILSSLETYVSVYLERINRANDQADFSKSNTDARKAAAMTTVAIAIPVSLAVFLSMIVLVLIIRIELHARKFASDFNQSISVGKE